MLTTIQSKRSFATAANAAVACTRDGKVLSGIDQLPSGRFCYEYQIEVDTVEQQNEDAQMIFDQITTSTIMTYNEALVLVVHVYMPDRTISRSGISKALDMLKKHYG